MSEIKKLERYELLRDYGNGSTFKMWACDAMEVEWLEDRLQVLENEVLGLRNQVGEAYAHGYRDGFAGGFKSREVSSETS